MCNIKQLDTKSFFSWRKKKINKNLHQDKLSNIKSNTKKKIIYEIPTKHTAQVSDFSQLQVLASTSQ